MFAREVVRDAGAIGRKALGQAEAERELLVVPGSPHRDGDRLAADPDLERLLDGDDVLLLDSPRQPAHGRTSRAVRGRARRSVVHRGQRTGRPARWHDPPVAAARFPIRFTGLNRAMVALGLSPSRSWVDVDDTTLRVRMGWGFHLDAPLVTVRDARLDDRRAWSWGVHGWRGSWLVNGSSSGIVRIDLDPPGRARTLGVPITVRELRVSVEDPDGLVAALATRR